MIRTNSFWEKIKRTSNDLTTLEINTVVKSDMTCLKPTDNDRLALYQLAGKYHDKLMEIGPEYYSCIQSKDVKDKIEREFEDEKKLKTNNRFTKYSAQSNLFRRIPSYEQGGIVSFVELAMVAKKARIIIRNNRKHFNRDDQQIENDCSTIKRIELKSLEIVSILSQLVKNKNEKVYKEFWEAYNNKQTMNGEEVLDRFKYLDNLHEILHNKVGLNENSNFDFINDNSFPITLDLRDQILVRKALDLGTERVVMQTRIGMDGDITTRIAEKFATNPEQFILDIHNESIQTSVGYWTTIVDALVSFGKNILKNSKL